MSENPLLDEFLNSGNLTLDGQINWLLDVIAPDRKVTGLVLANFRQVVKGGELRLHPLVTKMVEPEVLEKLAAGQPAAATAKEKV